MSGLITCNDAIILFSSDNLVEEKAVSFWEKILGSRISIPAVT